MGSGRDVCALGLGWAGGTIEQYRGACAFVAGLCKAGRAMVTRSSILGFCLIAAGGCAQLEDASAVQLSQCEARLRWSTDKTYACARCRAASTEPRCDCSDIPEKYKSRCNVPAARMQSASTCSDAERVELSGCLSHCRSDCRCELSCAAALSPSCAVAAQDLDGCVIDTCNEVCR